MASLFLESWQQRQDQAWIVGLEPKTLITAVTHYQAVLPQGIPGQFHPLVLITEPEPTAFLAQLFAACLNQCDVALANPAWGQREWQQVFAQLHPDQIIGAGPVPHPASVCSDPYQPSAPQRRLSSPESYLLIPTGGTSGRIRFAMHTWQTLTAAVEGFLQHFHQNTVHAYCVLPLYHVSGLMQALRTWLSGGQLVVQSFKQLTAGKCQVTPGADWFISLVPTQLQRLLSLNPALLTPDLCGWLAQFQAVLLGGAPAWSALLDQAQNRQIPIALTYGMTETAAQVATLAPQDFAQGNRSSGRILPHAQIQIDSSGQIRIRARSLMRGYWDTGISCRNWWDTDDIGYLDSDGYLHLQGRNSHKIITGGENVFPTEVEATLLATQLVKDACVVGLPDLEWGQIVAVLYVPIDDSLTSAQIKAQLTGQLSRYKQPKCWLATDVIPRNAQGKINRSAVIEIFQNQSLVLHR